MSDTTPTADQVKTLVETLRDTSHSISDAVENASSFITQIAVKYGPEAADLVLNVVRINAISEILGGLVCLGLCGATYKIGRKFWNLYKLGKYDNDHYSFLAALTWFCSAFFLIPSCVLLLNIWTWVAVFNPQLGLAGKIINKFIE